MRTRLSGTLERSSYRRSGKTAKISFINRRAAVKALWSRTSRKRRLVRSSGANRSTGFGPPDDLPTLTLLPPSGLWQLTVVTGLSRGRGSRHADRRDLGQAPRRPVPGPGQQPVPGPGITATGVLRPGTPWPEWNIYYELRHQLVARGLPREAIRFIHEAKSDRNKGRLFAACRAGSIAVLVGSTEKMGVGTNVQDRAIALHHLDTPWRPADVAQREGCILRQGNLNPEVSILRGYWSARRGSSARSCTAASTPATSPTSAAPPCRSAKSKRLPPATRCSWTRPKPTPRWPGCSAPNAPTQDALRQAIDHCEAEIARLTRLAGHIAAGVKRRQDTRGAHFTMTVGERRYDKRADAGQHLEQLAEGEISALTGLLERTVHAIGRRRHPSEAVR